MSRKFIFVLSISLWVSSCFVPAAAQDVLLDSLLSDGKKAFANRSYAASEKKLKAALSETESFSNDDKRLPEVLRTLAAVLDRERKLDEAVALYKRLVEIDEKSADQSGRSVLSGDLSNYANCLKRKGQSEAALKIYTRLDDLLSNAPVKNGSGIGDRVNNLINMAQAYGNIGQFTEQEKCLRSAVKLCQGDANASLSMAHALDALGSYYRMQARYDEAETMINQALAIAGRIEPDGGAETGRGLVDLARLQAERGKYKEAATSLSRAAAMLQKALGESDPDTWEAVIEVARLFEENNSYKEAIAILEKSRSAIERSFGEGSPRAAQFLRRLANDYICTNQYGRGDILLKQALAIDEKAYGEEAAPLALDLNAIGMAYVWQGRYDDAEPYYKRALRIVEAASGKDHPDVATCLNNLAWLYENEGRLDLARNLLERGLNIRTNALGEDHPATARNLHNLARVAEEQMKLPEAIQLLERTLKVQEEALGSSHPDAIATMSDLARLCQRTNQRSRSEELYRRLLAYDESTGGKESSDVADDLSSLASILIDENRNDEAKDMIARANKIKETLPGGQRMVGGGHGIKIAMIDPKVSAPNPVADKWALVIGISNFKDPSINLQYAAKDAVDFKNYLVSEANFKADHVKLLTDKDATRGNIIANLGDKWLAKSVKKDDLVLIFISSHGTSARKDAGSANFIVPYETNFNNALLTGIPMQWFTAGIKDLIPCDRVVVVMDVCHGGALRSISEADGFEPERAGSQNKGGKGLLRQGQINSPQLSVGCGALVIASSEADQLSWESKRYANGVFTRRLIEALRSQGSSTTLFQAYKHMRSEVEQEVLRDRAQIQTPVLISNAWNGGDLALALKPAAPRFPSAAEAAVSTKIQNRTKGNRN